MLHNSYYLLQQYGSRATSDRRLRLVTAHRAGCMSGVLGFGYAQPPVPLVSAHCCRERHEGLAARTKNLATGTLRRALVAVAADSQVAVMDAETGFTLSK
jgi:hypothetical protein